MSHYYKNNNIQAPLAKAKGMGSAKTGSHHWWMMKLTSIALIPLMLWFFFSIMDLIATGASYAAATEWVSTPYVAVILVIFLGINFYHAAIGGQEIILDYVPNKKIKIPSLIFFHFSCFAGGVTGIAAVLFIAFGG